MKGHLAAPRASIVPIRQLQLSTELLLHVPARHRAFSCALRQRRVVIRNDFRALALRAALTFGEKVDLHNSTAALTRAREVACGHEINHASADHDAGVQTTLANSIDC